ncbi:GNAT family N-acetyltransferase [Rhodococcus marinonascens]|uniref:GNAT family N-acetyltransferase n=1 Tax=Rhodococcus marinonascens TaxID=38311 RepID=UPI0009342C7A|nr:GNAT family N-acetyltransferase [Rhodococcus marinonascens]
MATTVEHCVAESRFEVFVDGQLAGYADYAEHGSVRDFHRTVTYPRFRGQGLAAEVLKAALDDTKARGFSVVPSCSYVAKYISQNPSYAELV